MMAAAPELGAVQEAKKAELVNAGAPPENPDPKTPQRKVRAHCTLALHVSFAGWHTAGLAAV